MLRSVFVALAAIFISASVSAANETEMKADVGAAQKALKTQNLDLAIRSMDEALTAAETNEDRAHIHVLRASMYLGQSKTDGYDAARGRANAELAKAKVLDPDSVALQQVKDRIARHQNSSARAQRQKRNNSEASQNRLSNKARTGAALDEQNDF